MTKLQYEYCRAIGALLLALVVIVLLSTPSMIFARSITTIGAELSYASNETFVRTKVDFGSNEHMRAFPRRINGWRDREYTEAETRLARVLHADVMLMREYVNRRYYMPIYFLIVQSNNRSSFHPPIVCYPALGYKIEEAGTVQVPIRNVSWLEEPLFIKQVNKTAFYSNRTITVKKLIVVKESPGGGITERRVVLYFYVKEKPLSNKITMIRVSALAPTHGSYNNTLNMTKEFMGLTIPYMFEPRAEEHYIITILSSSVPGKVCIVLVLAIPVMLIIYPNLHQWLRNRKVPPEIT